MTTMMTSKSLRTFLGTVPGHRVVCAYVGVRSTDPAAMERATQTALYFAPLRSARSWTLADLRAAAMRVDGAGVLRAMEVAR